MKNSWLLAPMVLIFITICSLSGVGKVRSNPELFVVEVGGSPSQVQTFMKTSPDVLTYQAVGKKVIVSSRTCLIVVEHGKTMQSYQNGTPVTLERGRSVLHLFQLNKSVPFRDSQKRECYVTRSCAEQVIEVL